MQNFGGYQLETGAALWSFGEHFRYTRDEAWARQVAPQLVKSCDFLLAWRERNKREDLRGRGYGLIEGKVADPEDPFHSFMLNGYAYLGLARCGDVDRPGPGPVRPPGPRGGSLEADIRLALEENLAQSPVVPLGDGTWCPPPAPGLRRAAAGALTDGNRCWTHGLSSAATP